MRANVFCHRYKHCPYLIALRPSHGCAAYSQLYDTTARGAIDLGQELSAYRGLYRSCDIDCARFIDTRIAFGPDVSVLCTSLVRLVGGPAVPPAWALGYLASSMAYTEAGDAQAQLAGFLAKLDAHALPCDGFHLSSGYTTDPKSGARMVFTWNQSKVPDPEQMFASFERANVGVIANVKPWLLDAHPSYAALERDGGFIRQAAASSGNNDAPLREMLWQGGAGTSATGSLIDFTSQDGYAFWKRSLSRELLSRGCRAVWNDNNEFEVDDDDARVHGCGGTVGRSGRARQTLLMARASLEALQEAGTQQRPVVISRSGCLGTHRYACQTWSGDNSTSFTAMRGNIRQMLSLGLCAWPGSGMDIGGFAGAMVTEELFVKWVRAGVWLPRFSIHSSSWKQGAGTNEPWMFPQSIGAVRAALQLRERLKVQLFSLHFEAHASGWPVCRPLLFRYQRDERARAVDDAWMLGSDVLVAPLLYAGQAAERAIYVPNGDAFADVDALRVLEGGREHVVSAAASKGEFQLGCAVLLRVGGGLVLSGSGFEGRRPAGAHERVVVLVAGVDGRAAVAWTEESGARCAVEWREGRLHHALSGQVSAHVYGADAHGALRRLHEGSGARL